MVACHPQETGSETDHAQVAVDGAVLVGAEDGQAAEGRAEDGEAADGWALVFAGEPAAPADLVNVPIDRAVVHHDAQRLLRAQVARHAALAWDCGVIHAGICALGLATEDQRSAALDLKIALHRERGAAFREGRQHDRAGTHDQVALDEGRSGVDHACALDGDV